MADDPSESPVRRLHAVVSGRVQGVSFRAYTQLRGRDLGLTGWVRNLPSGAVEVVAEGDADSLYAFVEFLHAGPPSARVEDVRISWVEPSGEFSDFAIRFF